MPSNNFTRLPYTCMVIDDDPVCIWIHEKALACAAPDLQVISFADPLKGFNYLAEHVPDVKGDKMLLFLDLNMPLLDGWGFLEKFARLDHRIRDAVDVYVLSSSLDPEDMERARLNPLVSDYMLKPLTVETVRLLLEDKLQECKTAV